MEGDPTPYLCVLVTAIEDCKFSIDFTSDKNSIHLLGIDTTTTLTSSSGQITIYKIDLRQYVYLKISRQEGFPYFQQKICKPDKQDISKCVEDFQNDESKGLQLADKVTTLDG